MEKQNQQIKHESQMRDMQLTCENNIHELQQLQVMNLKFIICLRLARLNMDPSHDRHKTWGDGGGANLEIWLE